MAFIDEVENFEAKAHLRKAAPLAAAGIAALALAASFFLMQGVFFGSGDFTVQQADAVSGSVSDVSSSQASDGAAAAGGASGSSSSADVCVYVTGAVKHPGVYRFDSSARVEDAVDAAGGFMRKADKASLNLARVLVDGEQIDVPAKGGTASASTSSAYSSSAATASARSGAVASASTEKVSINQATAEELKTLDGVGDATAQKIIDYRTANGPFRSIEDIKNVSGIAEKRFEAIADRMCV